MKEFWNMVEIKGIPIYQSIIILEKYGYQLFAGILHPTHNNSDYFKNFGERNKKAIEQALIELHYTV